MLTVAALPHGAAPREIEWTLGDRITKIRHVLGLEQRELADLLGVTDKAVSKWENDGGRPRDLLGVARRLAQLTAEAGTPVTEAWVLGVDGSRTSRSWSLVDLDPGQMELALGSSLGALVAV
jgi:transcriptional regulator with XRE-family HTH domain